MLTTSIWCWKQCTAKVVSRGLGGLLQPFINLLLCPKFCEGILLKYLCQIAEMVVRAPCSALNSARLSAAPN